MGSTGNQQTGLILGNKGKMSKAAEDYEENELEIIGGLKTEK